jgi:hypothetical protein
MMLFNVDDTMMKSIAQDNQGSVLFITCNQKSEICDKYAKMWEIKEPSIVG